MTLQGWLFMCVSVGSVLLLTGFCMFRVFTLPPPEVEDLKGPTSINTGDLDDAD